MAEFRLTQHCFLQGPGINYPAAYGRGGIAAHKMEGDGATPAGVLPLLRVLYRADRLKAPACICPVEPIGPNDGWCDDPLADAYNQPVRLPFNASHEILWREDALYDIIGVLGWNTGPVIKHRGSAIFLHIATTDYQPTVGCIALATTHLLHCLSAGLSAIRV